MLEVKERSGGHNGDFLVETRLREQVVWLDQGFNSLMIFVQSVCRLYERLNILYSAE